MAMKRAAIVVILLVSAVKPIVQGACDFCMAGFDDRDAEVPLFDDDGVGPTDCEGIRAQ